MSSLASSRKKSHISLRDTDSVAVTTDNCIYCRFFDQFYLFLCDSVTENMFTALDMSARLSWHYAYHQFNSLFIRNTCLQPVYVNVLVQLMDRTNNSLTAVFLPSIGGMQYALQQIATACLYVLLCRPIYTLIMKLLNFWVTLELVTYRPISEID